ncbi:putative porin, partial [Veillonella intestinalis]
AEQQALINRLADEFSSELNNLGVRVATLENKVGNVKATGDVRLRYRDFEHGKSKFDYRGRIQFNATVNDNTSAVVRITTGNHEFGNSSNSRVDKDGNVINSNEVSFDRAYVAHKFGEETTAVIGRFGAFIGGGLIYDDAFDGAAVAYDNGNFSATAAHGYFVEGDFKGLSEEDNATVTLLQAKGNLGEHATLGGFYAFGNKNLDDDIYGGHLDLNFDKVWIGGEYATFDKADHGDAWVAGVGIGNYDIKKAGTWGVKAQYFDLDVNAPVFSSTWNQPFNTDYKAWLATVDYALAKNVGLSAYWAFNGEDQAGNDVSDYYRAELNYKF